MARPKSEPLHLTFKGLSSIQCLIETMAAYQLLLGAMAKTLPKKEFGLTPNQALWLWIVKRWHQEKGEHPKRSQMVQMGYMLGSNPYYGLKNLTNMGYLIVTPDSEDRRSDLLVPTSTGEKVTQFVDRLFAQINSDVVKRLGQMGEEKTLNNQSRVAQTISDAILKRPLRPKNA